MRATRSLQGTMRVTMLGSLVLMLAPSCTAVDVPVTAVGDAGSAGDGFGGPTGDGTGFGVGHVCGAPAECASGVCCGNVCANSGGELRSACGAGLCMGTWSCAGTSARCTSAGALCGSCVGDTAVTGTCDNSGDCQKTNESCRACSKCVVSAGLASCGGRCGSGAEDATSPNTCSGGSTCDGAGNCNAPLLCDQVGTNAFVGCYYTDMDLGTLELARTDTTIDFDWGTGSPDPVIGNDSFSARWQGNFIFEAADHIFT